MRRDRPLVCRRRARIDRCLTLSPSRRQRRRRVAVSGGKSFAVRSSFDLTIPLPQAARRLDAALQRCVWPLASIESTSLTACSPLQSARIDRHRVGASRDETGLYPLALVVRDSTQASQLDFCRAQADELARPMRDAATLERDDFERRLAANGLVPVRRCVGALVDRGRRRLTAGRRSAWCDWR